MPTEEASFEKKSVVCTTGDATCDDLDLKLSRSWLRVAIASVFAGQGMVLSLALNMTPPDFGSVAYGILHGGLILSSVAVMAFLGGPLFASTVGMLRARQLSIEGLFTLSLAGAFVGSLVSSLTGSGAVFYEIVSIVIAIYTVGRMLSERSQAKLRLESEQLREHFDQAEVQVDGDWVAMPVSEVTPGSRVRIRPGSPFTLDGVVLSGVGYVRETALTGEPLPSVRRVGDRVRAGTWSEDGLFEVEAQSELGSRELDQILATVESGGGRPSALQTQANQLIQAFLPLVAGVSIATAIYWSFTGTWIEAVLNSMAVLLVACPCALGLATPVAIWQGLFLLARMGVLSRDGALIDALAQSKCFFFDKTGTLSEAAMRVTEIVIADSWQARRDALLAAVHSIESQLSHPIARALVVATNGNADFSKLRLIPGQGVAAHTSLGWVQIGEASLVSDAELEGLEADLNELGGKHVYVFVEGQLAMIAVVRERVREGVSSVWSELNALGIKAEVLTGDPQPELDLPEGVEMKAGLSAGEKEIAVRASVELNQVPVFVGDGINDTAAMACSAASIAMGSGTGLARSATSAQLRDDRLEALPDAVRLARGIHKRLRGNLVYAAAYNLVGMSLAAAGMLHPIVAALIMLVSSFWVTARALRVAV